MDHCVLHIAMLEQVATLEVRVTVGSAVHWAREVGGFKYFVFSPLLGEDFQFDEHIFQMGWFNHQLEEVGE